MDSNWCVTSFSLSLSLCPFYFRQFDFSYFVKNEKKIDLKILFVIFVTRHEKKVNMKRVKYKFLRRQSTYLTQIKLLMLFMTIAGCCTRLMNVIFKYNLIVAPGPGGNVYIYKRVMSLVSKCNWINAKEKEKKDERHTKF